jgi:hypothetical protein
MNYHYIDLPHLEDISKIVLKHLPPQFYKETLFSMTHPDVFKPCKPLVAAIETIRPWDEIQEIAVISVNNVTAMPIHVDQDNNTTWALNIPIQNCLETYTSFYRVLENQTPDVMAHERTYGTVFANYRLDQVEEIDRLYLTKAAFFNTQVPHRAFNFSDEMRIIISVRFKTECDIAKYFDNKVE